MMERSAGILGPFIFALIFLLVQPARGSTVYADEWGTGFDPNDSSAVLQGAIDSGADLVYVRNMGSPWITKHLYLRTNNQTLFFEPGVLIMAKEGEFKSTSAHLFRATDMNNITLDGYGATFRMRKEDYEGPNYDEGQHRIMIGVTGCTNVTIQGLTLQNSGGDGIRVGGSAIYGPCENVHIKDIVSEDHLRNALTITGATDVLIEDCVLRDSNSIVPMPHSGIHFEPNYETDKLSNILVRNLEISGNAGYGIKMGLRSLVSSGEDISIRIEDVTISDNAHGIAIRSMDQDTPNGLVELDNIMVEDIPGTGLDLADISSKSARIQFTDVTWKEVSKDGLGPLIIRASNLDSNDTPGGLDFIDCQVFDDQYRPVIRTGGQVTTLGLYDVHGDLYSDNPIGVWSEFPSVQNDVDLNIINGVVFPSGDASLDRKVGASDLALLAANWGEAGRWYDGDFDRDGNIGAADLALLAANWGHDGSGGSVPEPATFIFIAAGIPILLKCRQR